MTWNIPGRVMVMVSPGIMRSFVVNESATAVSCCCAWGSGFGVLESSGARAVKFRSESGVHGFDGRVWVIGFRPYATCFGEGRYKATWKRKFKLPWRKAGSLK